MENLQFIITLIRIFSSAYRFVVDKGLVALLKNLFLFICVILLFYIISAITSRSFGWATGSTPNADAEVYSITSKLKRRKRIGARPFYYTTVTFTDGFYYSSRSIKKDNKVLDEEVRTKIIKKAIKQHEKAVKKYKRRHRGRLSIG